MWTNRPTPASRAAESRSRVPSTMIRWNCSRGPCRIATRWTIVSTPATARRRLCSSVTSPSASSQPHAGQLRGLTRIPDEAAHGQVTAAQLVDDVATHEARAPRDEDQPAVSFWKFCQYLDGVGPRCPWYFEPIPPVPYGVSAASVSWTKEIWPIFISG